MRANTRLMMANETGEKVAVRAKSGLVKANKKYKLLVSPSDPDCPLVLN